MRTDNKDKTSLERRYFLTSLSKDAQALASFIRRHWEIENKLNWVLDVQFNEDKSRIRKDYSPENFAIVRQIALNLINKRKNLKKVNQREKKSIWMG